MRWGNKLIVILILLSNELYTQVDDYVKKLEAKFPKENFITTLESRKFKIAMKNNKPKVYMESYTEMILMNDFLRGIDEASVGYSKFRKLTQNFYKNVTTFFI